MFRVRGKSFNFYDSLAISPGVYEEISPSFKNVNWQNTVNQELYQLKKRVSALEEQNQLLKWFKEKFSAGMTKENCYTEPKTKENCNTQPNVGDLSYSESIAGDHSNSLKCVTHEKSLRRESPKHTEVLRNLFLSKTDGLSTAPGKKERSVHYQNRVLSSLLTRRRRASLPNIAVRRIRDPRGCRMSSLREQSNVLKQSQPRSPLVNTRLAPNTQYLSKVNWSRGRNKDLLNRRNQSVPKKLFVNEAKEGQSTAEEPKLNLGEFLGSSSRSSWRFVDYDPSVKGTENRSELRQLLRKILTSDTDAKKASNLSLKVLTPKPLRQL